MIINHNMQSINAHRQMGVNQANAQKSMEKLSSGLRINRAGDDAAGLAISEKMRGQIRGLDQAGRNAQDGISLIQTAEGALNETHSILQRMRELGVQSANDTNTDADRVEIQKEIEQLTEEIDRIGNTTEFNTKKLLQGDGSSALEKTGIVADSLTEGTTTKTQASADIILTAKGADDTELKVNIGGKDINVKLSAEDKAEIDAAAGTELNKTAELLAKKINEAIKADDTLKGSFTATSAVGKITIAAVSTTNGGKFDGAEGVISAGTITGTGSAGATSTSGVGITTNNSATKDIDFSSIVKLQVGGANADGVDSKATEEAIKDLIGKGLEINGQKIEFYNVNDGAYKGDAIGVDISKVLDAAKGVTGTKAAAATDTTAIQDAFKNAVVDQIGTKLEGVTITASTGGNITVTSKATGEDAQLEIKDGATKKEFEVSFQVGANEGQNMSVKVGDMRAEALGISKLDLSKKASAESAITVIDKAMTTVSSQRSNLGAVQNRLEHTINNLGTSSENLTAAESRIRDVDMAKEMMTMSKNNILNQAAQAMLAQANQAPQQVLQLLR